MKKIFKYIIVVVLTLGIVVGTLYNDYKESQAAVLPVAIWGMTESVLALFGAFGLGVGVNQAYQDSSVVDKDALTLLQDFRGFLARGSNLNLPYTLIEKQLNTLEKTLAEAQLKGYLTLIRGGVTGQESPTPDGPKKNKFEKGLIDSIKQYVIARNIFQKAYSTDKPISSSYDADFFYNKFISEFNKYHSNYWTGLSDFQENNLKQKLRDKFNFVQPSDFYFFGISDSINSDATYNSFSFYISSGLRSDQNFNDVLMTRVTFRYNQKRFLDNYSFKLDTFTDGKIGVDHLTNTNWQPLIAYKESHSVNDLGTFGKITVDGGVGAIIERDGNLDNYDIITHGTKVNPDGSVEGDINIPVPKKLPQNEPLPAGQTQPALDYGKQIDYGIGKDINGNTAINNIPSPDAVAEGEWTPDEQSGIEKSKNLSMLFPFCIPFDLIDAFKLLSAKPQVPKWEFDWKIPTIDFSHHFVIDLSSFNILFMVLNKMILLSFIVGLILVTRNIIRG